MARRLVLRLGVMGVVKGAVESCATSGGALFHLIGFACRRVKSRQQQAAFVSEKELQS